MQTAIWWIRRDLRLMDNEALTHALQTAESVIPVFVIDPILLKLPNMGEKRLAFLWGALRQLDADLRAKGSRLIMRRGRPLGELTQLLREAQAEVIFAEEDFTPYARRRDAQVANALPLRLVGGTAVHQPAAVLKADGTPHTVFTPFSKAWKERPFPTHIQPVPDHIHTPQQLDSLPIPAKPELLSTVPFPTSEAEAQRRLRAFTETPIFDYAEARDRLDLVGTSQLSPYLHFGMISARQTAVAAQRAMECAGDAEARKGATSWLNELIWREFYISILYHFPHVLQRSFREQYDRIQWNEDVEMFEAWQNGRTGFPVVDAAMQQLLQSGWMHNRARMIVASFLVKDLLINWQWGERHFMQHLVDGDLASNNGGWQWTAGVGTDAAPYFRIFNPTLQSKKFDPDGRYIRRWLPQLANVPDKYIHEPAKMPAKLQQEIGCMIGRDYPAPIIDHKQARQRTLEAYGEVKQ
jgi:deoxyribodipyrimidine photo-lyase